jgi:hypothetical protein
MFKAPRIGGWGRLVWDLVGGLGFRSAVSAPIGAIFHFVPALLPLFAPGERKAADEAGFGGEVGFFSLTGHSFLGEIEAFAGFGAVFDVVGGGPRIVGSEMNGATLIAGLID